MPGTFRRLSESSDATPTRLGVELNMLSNLLSRTLEFRSLEPTVQDTRRSGGLGFTTGITGSSDGPLHDATYLDPEFHPSFHGNRILQKPFQPTTHKLNVKGEHAIE